MSTRDNDEDLPFYNVSRWTKDVDIFAHAQVIFPLSTGTHWYLTCFIDVAQCFLSNDELKETETEQQRRPYILVLNSKEGIEINNDIDELKSYLIEEWIAKKESVAHTAKRKCHDTSKFENISLTCNLCKSGFTYSIAEQGLGLSQPKRCKQCTDERKGDLRQKLQIPILRPKSPQQENLFDCGVYCVKNAEQVIEKTPKIGQNGESLTENLNDYTQNDINEKRESMKELLTQLIQLYKGKNDTI
jgi:Ulp1 family protease